jgi:maltoporin
MCTNMLAASAGAITFGAAGLPGTSGIAACDQDFNWWGVGSRSQWNITPWFYVGVDVLYQKIESASNGAIVTYTAAAGTAKPTALYAIQNQDNVGIRVRLHRDIVP